MAQEDKSVRKLVQEIESRTGKLDKAIEKLSDSLERIGASLTKPPEEGPGREDLIKKFKQPFASPDAVKKDDNSEELLDQIKDAIVFNQKDNFALFKSIDDTLKKINDKGGGLGGMGFDIGGKGGKGTKGAKGKAGANAKAASSSVKPGKAGAEVAKKAAGKAAGGAASKVGGALAKGARFLPGVGLAVAGGMAAMDAYSGYNEAESVLGIEDREATMGEKLSAGAGGLVSGLTMGLVGRDTAAKGIESARQSVMGFFGGGDDKKKEEAQPVGPIPSTGAPTISKPKAEGGKESTVTSSSFSKEYLEKVISGEHPRPLISKEKAQELLKAQPQGMPSSATSVTPVEGEATKQTEFSKEYLEKVISGEHPRPLITKEKAQELLKKQEEAATPASQVTPSSSSVEPSQSLNQMSQENAEMKSEGQAVQPVVVNNSSSVTSNKQSFTPLRATARPNNNAFERMQMAVSSF